MLPGALFCSWERSLLSAPYCSPSCKQNIPSMNIMPTYVEIQKVAKKIAASRNLSNLHTYIRTWHKPRTYRVEIGITYIHTYGLGTSQDPTYIGPHYKKKNYLCRNQYCLVWAEPKTIPTSDILYLWKLIKYYFTIKSLLFMHFYYTNRKLLIRAFQWYLG